MYLTKKNSIKTRGICSVGTIFMLLLLNIRFLQYTKKASVSPLDVPNSYNCVSNQVVLVLRNCLKCKCSI